LYGQDQHISDSIRQLIDTEEEIDSVYLERLRIIAEEETDPAKKKQFAERLIILAKEGDNTLLTIKGFLQKGNAEVLQGNFPVALETYFAGIGYANSVNDFSSLGKLYTSIAGIYTETGNFSNAMNYYNKAISTLRETDDRVSLAGTLLNAGDAYFYSGKYDSALIYNKEADRLFKDLNYAIGSAYTMGNTGMVYAALGDNEQAETAINEAIDILMVLEDYYPISVYLIYVADIYLERNDIQSAKNYVYRSLDLARQHGLKDQISQANLKLAEIYDLMDDPATAYSHYREHILYRDSVNNIEAVQKMADLRTDYEVSQKQIEIDLADQRRKNQRNISIATAIALFLILLMAIGLYRRNTFIRKTKQIIEEEKERSDALLLNILPEETALELKEKGKVKAKKYDSVTVLFTDFKGFTSYSEKLSPEALVETIDFYFSKFDAIIEKYGLEKIKTIGDAYMCVGGLHETEENHATRMVSAAMEIVSFVEETKNDVAASELTFDIRIGINTGPVVAGVVGTHKFAYDIWGDAVNVASRMESMSEPGKINISEDTFALIKDEFNCTYRGEIEAKNRGALKMYFVEGKKNSVPTYS
jgi:class 3 adenylate cyclase